MPWWGWVLTVVGGLALLGFVAVRTLGAEDRNTVSWWAGRNGYRYTGGTPELLDLLGGEPFDRGADQQPHDVLSGEIAGRPGLLVQFSWYRLSGSGASGLRSGMCAAAVLELPAAVPELTVRPETGADRVRGRDLQLESVEFNEAFRIEGTVDRFSYDVLNPRAMSWLLAHRGYSFRFAGRMLVAWREGMLDAPEQLGDLAAFAATLYGMVPGFAYTAGHPAAPGPAVSELPPAALGSTPSGTVAFLQRLTHRGHPVERYEHPRKLWGVEDTAVSVTIPVPTVWPVLMIAAKRLAADRGRQPRFDDGVVAGQERFDRLFACGTPRPDFALAVLRPEFTDLLLDRPETRSASVVLQSADDGTGANRGGIWVSATGRLADTALADRLTELACDLVEALPAAALRYHLDDPVPDPPEGGWPNTRQGYFVQPGHRV
ncbi:MAG TPA: hypothetical protein VHH15_17440 [Actinophytocola sp.]|nr:hypothetical protein [Actinophytocola sp.]